MSDRHCAIRPLAVRVKGMSAQRGIDEIAEPAYKRAGLFTGTVALPTGDRPQRCLSSFSGGMAVRSTRAGRQGLVMGLLALMLGAPVVWTAEQRDLVVMPKVAPGSVAIGGEYRALIIGIDKYRHVPPLGTAVRDALALRDMLLERYGFKPDHITLVVNDQATQRGIVDALYRLRKQAGKDDSVLIYYAGHGQIDADDGMGYWVPVEGEAHSPGTFLSNAVIRDEIANMKAKHVYVVADSCFAGSLFAKSRTLLPLNDKFFARLYATKSRWGLTSGQNEPVTDRGKDGHSIFAYFLLKLLGENEDPYLVPSHIYDEIAPLIGRNTEQQPRSEPLQNAGDEGGQFVFRLAVASGGPRPGGLAPAKPVPVPGGPSAALSQAEQELKALQAQERQAEEQEKLVAIQAQIEAKKKQIAEKKKKVKLAKVMPYEAPQQAGREITGRDGARMVLVPAGEFLMGSNDSSDEKPPHRVYLDDFYMDKYEVTTKRYAAFLQATSREKPQYWNDVSLVSDGDRPVIGVTWHDADAYCRQYGQRLPTEAEWEKAARGTDGRKYPWGNEEPSGRYANFGKSSWSGYATLTAAGEYEAGKSPYGMYDMAGNVWEWVADWYDKDYYQHSPDRNPTGPSGGLLRVSRGGSWFFNAGFLLSAYRFADFPTDRHYAIGFRCAKTP